ncbi:hypothetical protein [Paenibacillus oceani]|uniref:Uncharacterized protein n=1 Tax=Paenibacillus oceani TaxID=2772510 RepID=A0A927C8A5_9BACL|nr:hypothetical protein [Paenibacillus oceani]MBD2862689.1 hypothetical protein [Paenibacillus oceani]
MNASQSSLRTLNNAEQSGHPNRFISFALPGTVQPAELEKLPCLTRIHDDMVSESLLAFLAGNPFINELQVCHSGNSELDLSACRVNRLTIRTRGLEQLTH